MSRPEATHEASVHWTEDRCKVREWLAGKNAALREIYCSVVEILKLDAIPGRARIIGHCVRELRNGLVRTIVGQEESRQFKDTNAIKNLVPLWQQARVQFNSSIAQSGAGVPLNTDLLVSKEIVTMISEIVDGHLAATDKNIDRAIALFERLQLQAPDDPQQLKIFARDWWKLGDWFMGKLHNWKDTDEQLFNEEFEQKLTAFEARLISFAKAPEYVAGLEEIDEILDATNR